MSKWKTYLKSVKQQIGQGKYSVFSLFVGCVVTLCIEKVHYIVAFTYLSSAHCETFFLNTAYKLVSLAAVA